MLRTLLSSFLALFLTRPTEAAPTVPASGKRWTLKSRPTGVVSTDNFALERVTMAADELAADEVLIQVELLSIDAFLRTMLDETAFHGSVSLGSVLPAVGMGTVVASNSKKFKVGSRVMGMLGAQSYARLSATKSPPEIFPAMKLPGVPLRAMLGALSLTTGITAYVGLFSVAKPPRKGQTVVVTAAAGAVGSIAAQLAKRTGAKVIGVAGGKEKCTFLEEALALDGAVDYKSDDESVGAQLDRLAPEGIDFLFDNTGGPVLDAVLDRLKPNKKARVVVCGGASQYSGNLNHGKVVGPSSYLKLSERSATMHGFVVFHFMHKLPAALAYLWWLTLRKKLVMHEQVEQGLEAFGEAMTKMWSGGHVGKLFVNVSATGLV